MRLQVESGEIVEHNRSLDQKYSKMFHTGKMRR
jgi:hypothetical protein